MFILDEKLDVREKTLEECVGLLLAKSVRDEEGMMKVVRSLCSKNKVSCLDLKKSSLLNKYHELLGGGIIQPSLLIENLLRKRRIRTQSGVSVISVMTKPLSCPGKCVYCPSQPNMPKSYLDNQPAAMRGVMNDFDPFEQVWSRLVMLKMMGHDISKNEVIILGGTFSAHPVRYQELFIKRIFDAFNVFGVQIGKRKNRVANNLSEAKKINEGADCRCIGMTIETRPDFVTYSEVKWLRYLGVTRVELGVQSVYDDVLKKNKRGHTVEVTKAATRILREAGFKIVYHVMPGLWDSDFDRDIEMFEKLFSDSGFFPDHLKIYPTVVLENSELYDAYMKGQYKPLTQEEVVNLLSIVKKKIPRWVRIVRVMRDIPESSIVAGVKSSNLRQLIQDKGANCQCIRCREPRGKKIINYKLKIKNYTVSNGREIFLSIDSKDGKYILALLRLFLPENTHNVQRVLPELEGCAIVRELHTYGQVVKIDDKKGKTQHRGFGRMLMIKAEDVAKKNGFKRIAVIAGVGVRQYYAKLDYQLIGEYMVKNIMSGIENIG